MPARCTIADGRAVAVHSHCYGAPLSVAIPEGDWICLLCWTAVTSAC